VFSERVYPNFSRSISGTHGVNPGWRVVLHAATLTEALLALMAVRRTDGLALASILVFGIGYLTAVWYQRQLRTELAHARRDPVTGLPVRAVAEAILQAATVAGTHVTVALADVDGLGAVNNRLGHAAGDQYLAVIASRLQRAATTGSTVCRTGGDELIVLAPETEPEELAAAIDAVMHEAAVIAGRRMQLRLSVGIADSGGGSPRRALARADAAMYSAKESGGNTILIFDPRRDGEPMPDGSRPLVRRREQPASRSDI
jgi:diguanylate cyclase (GGDEF)-like protein